MAAHMDGAGGSCAFWTLHVVLWTLCMQHGGADTVTVNGKVYAELGSNATLFCKINTNEHLTQVTWQRKMSPHNENFLTYSIGEPTYLTAFGRRVIFMGNGGKGNIQILNVTLADEGTYLCIFTTFPGGEKQKEIELIVQVPATVKVVPSTVPVLPDTCQKILGECIAQAAKPAAKIVWITDGFSFISVENETIHDNGTITTWNRLIIEKFEKINSLNVTCVVSQPHVVQNRSFTIQNIQYAPSVFIRVIPRDEELLLVCEADSSPPATNFIWKRVEATNSVDLLGTGELLLLNNSLSGLYICDVENKVGNSSGNLYIFEEKDACVSGYIRIIIVSIAIISIGILFAFVWHTGISKNRKKRSSSSLKIKLCNIVSQ
ncbi:nectin-1-like [Discoglossus pictus]